MPLPTSLQASRLQAPLGRGPRQGPPGGPTRTNVLTVLFTIIILSVCVFAFAHFFFLSVYYCQQILHWHISMYSPFFSCMQGLPAYSFFFLSTAILLIACYPPPHHSLFLYLRIVVLVHHGLSLYPRIVALVHSYMELCRYLRHGKQAGCRPPRERPVSSSTFCVCTK